MWLISCTLLPGTGDHAEVLIFENDFIDRRVGLLRWRAPVRQRTRSKSLRRLNQALYVEP